MLPFNKKFCLPLDIYHISWHLLQIIFQVPYSWYLVSCDLFFKYFFGNSKIESECKVHLLSRDPRDISRSLQYLENLRIKWKTWDYMRAPKLCLKQENYVAVPGLCFPNIPQRCCANNAKTGCRKGQFFCQAPANNVMPFHFYKLPQNSAGTYHNSSTFFLHRVKMCTQWRGKRTQWQL